MFYPFALPFNRALLRFLSLTVLVTVLPFAGSAATTTPKPITTTQPEFPAALRKSGKEGKAILRVTISETGSVSGATVKSADATEFGTAALNAVQSWTFTPAQRDGAPVPITVEIPFVFNLPLEEKINGILGRPVFVAFDEPVVEMKVLKERPKTKKPIRPLYPKSLAGSGKSADVKLEYIVNTKGQVINPGFLSEGPDELRVAALFAVAVAEYAPIMHEGKAVNCRMITTVKMRETPPGQPAPGAKKPAPEPKKS